MFTLPELPYAEDALAPHISAQTMALHHGKHHKSYVDKLNALLVGDPLADLSLEEVIQKSHGHAARQGIFNNAAQCWNHSFFWTSMTPDGGGAPVGAVAEMISRDIGNPETFEEAFVKAATEHFGSGWVWLVLNGDKVEIMTTHDADLPLVHGQTALMTCDLWEHAYYLDYQNKRPDFIHAFLDHLVDWDFANANLATAKSEMAEAA
jgi:superoxide dismutase, Fe-Mn family